jgi:hypothetical protein
MLFQGRLQLWDSPHSLDGGIHVARVSQAILRWSDMKGRHTIHLLLESHRHVKLHPASVLQVKGSSDRSYSFCQFSIIHILTLA